MLKRLSSKLSLIAMLVPSIVFSAIPKDVEKLDLEEGFIELRVGKKGNPFYGVLIDQNENPYVEIIPFMETWFGIEPNCSIEAKQCQVRLPDSESIHWFSANSKEFGKGDDKRNWEVDNAVIVNDGSMWIKHDQIDKWIPVNATWSIRSYILSVIPQFKLSGIKLAELAAARNIEIKKKKEREEFLKSKSIKPSSDYSTEARSQYTSRYDVKNNVLEHSFSYDIASDIYKGTLGLGGDLLSEDANEHIGYWFYENKSLDIVDYAGIGDVRFDGSLIANNKLLKNGIRIDRRYREDGVGKFSKREFTEPNSIIDVYINGFYQDSVRADKFGFYKVDDLFVKGGDTVRFREVTPKGFENEKRYVVSGSNGGYLEKDKWDTQFIYGEEDELMHSFADLKYGVGEHFTAGFNFYGFEIYDDKSEIKSNFFVSNIMLWRFNSAFSVAVELGLNERSNAYRADWNISDRAYLSWESRKVDENSLMINSDWFEDYGYSYNRLRHNYVFGRTQFKTTILNQEDENSYELEVAHKLQGRFSLNGTIGYEDRGEQIYSEILVNKALEDGGTIEGGVKYQSEIVSLFGYWRTIGQYSKPWSDVYYDRPWSANFGFTYDESNGISPTASIDWQQTDWLSANVSATKENVFIGITMQFGGSNNKGSSNTFERQSWHSFGSGSISGRLMSPSENGVSEAVAGATVQVSNFKATTNENGYFFLDGIPANDEMEMFVDESTIDIRMLPEDKKWKVKLRPGTKLVINPKMVWSVGVDGFIEGVKSGTITFINRYNDSESQSIIESDGFYIIERLSPGDYDVKIDAPGMESVVYSYTVESGDWFSDVNFKIN